MMMAKLVLLAALMVVPSMAALEQEREHVSPQDAAWAKSPLKKVVDMLTVLKGKVEGEGTTEQQAYDKYACWVEATLAKKSTDISTAQTTIETLGTDILGLKASTSTLTAEIKELKKDIAENVASTKETTALRKKENAAFEAARVDSVQSIESLGKAIVTLTGAGTFLAQKATGSQESFRSIALAGVAESLREIMENPQAQSRFSPDEIDVVSQFIRNPKDSSSQGMIATQTDANPAGDYAPASSQIQGILKSMKDSMSADLASDIKEEKSSLDSFNALMKQKASESSTLNAGLLTQTSTSKTQEKSLSDKETLQDNTATMLDTDQEFFKDTKEAAVVKSTEWSTRVRLRVEEIAGMQGAIDILMKGASTIGQASLSFLQVSKHEETLSHLKALAEKYHSENLVKVHNVLKTVLKTSVAGHFDAVIQNINKMQTTLRTEEQDDIAHRDRCEGKQNDNANDIADATANIETADQNLKRMGNTGKELANSVTAAKNKITSADADLKSLTALRLKDHTNFGEAMKVDGQTVEVIAQATTVLSKFYASQKVGVSLRQIAQGDVTEEAPPKTEFKGTDSHQGEATNIVAILSMMKEDFEKEIKEGKADEAKDQAEFAKQKAALKDTIDAQTDTKVSLEKEQLSLTQDESGQTRVKKQENSDLTAANVVKKAIETDCSWVKTQFKSRKTKRDTEMEGLVDAKDYLAGVAEGRPVI